MHTTIAKPQRLRMHQGICGSVCLENMLAGVLPMHTTITRVEVAARHLY